MKEFSHMDETGRARMVDVSQKKPCFRRASAEGKLFVSPETLRRVREHDLPKGSPGDVARLAGVMGAKRTADLIPLCHPLNLDFIDVEVSLGSDHLMVRSEVRCRRSTGVEMEALTAVSVALLALYDMCKAVDSQMELGEIRLLEKEKSN